ncbi:MAG: DMT family transporter [Geminicoccaceae bacterium]
MATAAAAVDPRHRGGVLLVFLSFVAFSTGGVILRFIDTDDGFAILFWRSVPWLAAMLLFVSWRNGWRLLGPMRHAGPSAVLVGLGVTGSACGYIFGVQLTTVANVVFTFSATPFLTALLARWLLGERVSTRTWIAIAAALTGIGLMVGDGLETGSWLGNLLALGASLSFSLTLIVLRRAGQSDMLPGTVWGGIISLLVGGLLAGDLGLSATDIAWCAAFGISNMTVGLVLLTLGARHVPAAETALLALTESVLAPIWVWLVFSEQPGPLTLAGGLVVLAAVAWRALSPPEKATR